MTQNSLIRYNEEVLDALNGNKPVVAVETGYLYHRDTYVDNIESALKCTTLIRDTGAVPAVIAIKGGQIHIGLDNDRLVEFLQLNDVKKCNMRDIAAAVTQNKNGVTTVSAALHAAHLAGIRILAAGGIGGVHRGAADTFDISPDLIQLARAPVAVVCSGAKSILDLGLTMEYLETQGVTIAGYGTALLPAYYLSETSFPLETVLHNPSEAAALIRGKELLGDRSGLIVANPINKQFAVDRHVFDAAMHKAVREAEQRGIGGKRITAFLLDKVSEATKGSAAEATRQLQFGNAVLAAKIAVELSYLDQKR